MKASTKTVFESDPDRLPPITFVVGPHIALAVAEAIDALVRGDLDACLASANTPGLDGQDRLLALIASGLAHYRKGDFAECERIAAVMKALAPNVSFVELFSAVSLEYRGRVDLASTGFVAALSLSAGLTVKDSFEKVIAAIGDNNFALLKDPTVVMAGFGMARTGAWSKQRDVVAPRLVSIALEQGREPSHRARSLLRILTFLGLADARDPAWQDAIFDQCALPMLEALLREGRVDTALALELDLFQYYVKTLEIADRHRNATVRLAPMFAAAGRTRGATLPAIRRLSQKQRYRVGFVAFHLGELAHARAALDIVECLHARPLRRIDVTLVAMNGAEPEFVNRCHRAGVPVHVVAPQSDFERDAEHRYLELRSFLEQGDFDAVTWITASENCAYAFALPLAPA